MFLYYNSYQNFCAHAIFYPKPLSKTTNTNNIVNKSFLTEHAQLFVNFRVNFNYL